MENQTIFGLPTVLVLMDGDCEIRVDDWIIADDQTPTDNPPHALNFAKISEAISEHQEKGEDC